MGEGGKAFWEGEGWRRQELTINQRVCELATQLILWCLRDDRCFVTIWPCLGPFISHSGVVTSPALGMFETERGENKQLRMTTIKTSTLSCHVMSMPYRLLLILYNCNAPNTHLVPLIYNASTCTVHILQRDLTLPGSLGQAQGLNAVLPSRPTALSPP